MTCLNITLSASLSNASSLPFAEVDTMISPGTLMLWEPGHPANNSVNTTIAQTGAATNYMAGTAFPNIAQRPASVACNIASFTVTASFATNVMTVTGTPSGIINVGDDIYTTGGTLVGRITGSGTAGGAGNYNVWPAPGTIASANFVIIPSVKPTLVRNKPQSSGVDVDFKYEWTPKGGLHIVSSQSTQGAAGLFALTLPSAVKDYMAANPSHSYYYSTWYKVTRVALSGFTGPYISLQSNSGATNGFFSVKTNGPVFAPTNSAVGVGARNTLGNITEQMSNTYTGAALADPSASFLAYPFGFGTLAQAYGDYGNNKSMSAVLYRIFIEDLTLSGRSFATVKAIDDALQVSAFGSTGRYYNDTYTAPATLLP